MKYKIMKSNERITWNLNVQFIYIYVYESLCIQQKLMQQCKSTIFSKCAKCAKSIQSCSTFCNPMDCSPPGSSVHGIVQATILEWVAISFSRGSSWPRDRTCVFCIDRQILYPLATVVLLQYHIYSMYVIQL